MFCDSMSHRDRDRNFIHLIPLKRIHTCRQKEKSAQGKVREQELCTHDAQNQFNAMQ